MRRVLIGLALVLHGLAHAGAAVWAEGQGRLWLATALWLGATVGFVASGFGVLRVPVVRHWWRPLAAMGAFASGLLLLTFGHPYLIPGLAIDLALLIVALGWAEPSIEREVEAAEQGGVRSLHHPTLHRVAFALAWTGLVYASAVVLLRPWYLRWGSTETERLMPLPGDEIVREPTYQLTHAITIHAPARAVWPWLAQVGQDRAGFYSYDWLERAVGDDIHNASVVRAEWQHQRAGEFVRAVQPGWFFGFAGSNVGWPIAALQRDTVLALEGWGAFVLVPIDSVTTRLIVRTRAEYTPSITAVALSPIATYAFEPAHWIMQRGMMRGIRDRAEGAFRRLGD